MPDGDTTRQGRTLRTPRALREAGLLRPDEGRIEIDGRPANSTDRSRYIAYLSHLTALKQDLGCLENLHFLCGLQGRRARQMPGNALAIVGLAGYEDTLVRQLSAGQKKRLSLARIWLSPAPKRFTRTWAISAAHRSGWAGWGLFSRRWC